MTQETQVSPVAETEIQAADVAETPEVATPEQQVETEQQTSEPDDGEKTLKRLQRRIDKRTADVYRERAEKEQLSRELETLRAKLAPAQEEKPVTLDSIKPIAEQMARQIRQQEKFTDQVRNTLKAGEGLTGFNDACNAVDAEIGFYQRDGSPTDFLKVVLESDAPAKLLHHLGQNPDLAAELAELTPTQMARRIDRIERDMASPKQTSSAPKPLTPVKAAAADSSLASAKSDEEWARMRDRELAERRKQR